MGRACGLLRAVRVERNCQITQIGQRQIVLPAGLKLGNWVGQNVLLFRLDDTYPIRRAEP
jgi:hypothetical protein